MYRLDLEERFQELNSSPQGLSDTDAFDRLKKYGPNEIQGEIAPSILSYFFSNFKDVMILVLLAAAALSFVLREITDGIIILVIVLLNAVISTVQSTKARNALQALQSMAMPESVVLRDGVRRHVKSRDLVPGDVVLLETGNIIPADGRLIESINLRLDESALTGESVPVEKDEYFVADENIPIGDRKNMLYASTIVTYGRGSFLVTNTGMDTEIGKIAFMILGEEKSQTPLQEKLATVGRVMAALVLLIAAGVFALGIFQGRDLKEMFFTAVSLAVAAIPEGLPAVVTIVLALGVIRLSKRNAIVRNLPSVETLGSSSVICSDKTGTLTQNRMKVIKAFMFGDENERLIEGLALCNDAIYNETEEKLQGDPTETALIDFAYEMEILKADLDQKYPRVGEIPFDSERKRMTTLHGFEGKFHQYTKGGLDEILKVATRIWDEGEIRDITTQDRYLIYEKHDEYAKEALRVLALAWREESSDEGLPAEENMVFVGMVGLMDPPRDTSAESIKQCRRAGIIPVMITGDHLETASAIAKEIGILTNETRAITGRELENMSDEDLLENIRDIRVYARVAPQHKVRIVEAWQSLDEVVAMTGDGVNDAPALKMADIGVAMGKVGTDVSRNSSDMILADDNFATIVAAVEEGRGIYDNIKRTIRFLLSCNFGEIVLILAAMILGNPMPLLPIHILWVNLVSDSFPALALGVEPSERDVMNRPPRPKKEKLLTPKNYVLMVLEGVLIGAISYVAFRVGLLKDVKTAQTMAFLTITLAQLVHAINMRSLSTIFGKGFFSNRWFHMAFLTSLAMLLVVYFLPPLANVFRLTTLDMEHWLFVAGLSVIPLVFTEIRKIFVKG